MNHWFRRHAWTNQENDSSRTSVICDASSEAVAGFVSLSAAQIERAYLPKTSQRNRPDPVPVVLLGQLAVDTRYRGQGCASSLTKYALLTALRFSEHIGCIGVVTQPLDDGVRSFYAAFDFRDLPFDPARRMIVRIVDLKHSIPDIS
ncbi:GNAT family N-acetyltransferase [Mesorhizobium sp. IMUNJ 23232]|uniref:GNAT family N-acetyltransferase n=1 Tax=Mesorhizobium sp. IMUNJ 23232 TaxID=3376064 RepID=UPI0037BB27FB